MGGRRGGERGDGRGIFHESWSCCKIGGFHFVTAQSLPLLGPILHPYAGLPQGSQNLYTRVQHPLLPGQKRVAPVLLSELQPMLSIRGLLGPHFETSYLHANAHNVKYQFSSRKTGSGSKGGARSKGDHGAGMSSSTQNNRTSYQEGEGGDYCDSQVSHQVSTVVSGG